MYCVVVCEKVWKVCSVLYGLLPWRSLVDVFSLIQCFLSLQESGRCVQFFFGFFTMVIVFGEV